MRCPALPPALPLLWLATACGDATAPTRPADVERCASIEPVRAAIERLLTAAAAAEAPGSRIMVEDFRLSDAEVLGDDGQAIACRARWQARIIRQTADGRETASALAGIASDYRLMWDGRRVIARGDLGVAAARPAAT